MGKPNAQLQNPRFGLDKFTAYPRNWRPTATFRSYAVNLRSASQLTDCACPELQAKGDLSLVRGSGYGQFILVRKTGAISPLAQVAPAAATVERRLPD